MADTTTKKKPAPKSGDSWNPLHDIANYAGDLGNLVKSGYQHANSALQPVANAAQQDVYGPLGSAENAVGHALFAHLYPSGTAAPSSPAAPAKGKGKGKAAAPGPQKFDLAQADQTAAAPYVNELYAALGIKPGQQATANSEIPGGLAQYLTNVPANERATLTSGLNNEAQADQGMIGAAQNQMSEAGNAGLLSDLLNAARYQAIYKQGLYAPAPPSNTSLGQLYNTVVSGGNALAGGAPGATTTNPFNSTQPGGTSPTGAKNPYGTKPPGV